MTDRIIAESDPNEKLIAVFHVGLSVEHLPELVEALQLCVGEKLYFRGPGLQVVSKGEVFETTGGEHVRGYLTP